MKRRIGFGVVVAVLTLVGTWLLASVRVDGQQSQRSAPANGGYTGGLRRPLRPAVDWMGHGRRADCC